MNNKKKELKSYMAYNIYAGLQEGAFLVFHYTAREAKKIAFLPACHYIIDNEYDFISLAVRLIKDAPWLMEEKRKEEPHVIDDPRYCIDCKQWGHSAIGTDSLCDDCRGEENENV